MARDTSKFQRGEHDLLFGLGIACGRYANSIFRTANGDPCASLGAFTTQILQQPNGIVAIYDRVDPQVDAACLSPQAVPAAHADAVREAFYEDGNLQALATQCAARFSDSAHAQAYKAFFLQLLRTFSSSERHDFLRNFLQRQPQELLFGRMGKTALALLMHPDNRNMVIHFVLDGLDLAEVSQKAPPPGHGRSATSRELRAAYRLHQLFGERFSERCMFLKDGKAVPPPWNDTEWTYRPRTERKLNDLLVQFTSAA